MGKPLKVMVLLALLGLSATQASAGTIFVSGLDDIFLAGLSSVPTGFPYNSQASGGDGAGTLPVGIPVNAGELITISASGEVSCCYGGSPINGPDGGGLGGSTSISGYENVAGYSSGTQLALLGVFETPSTSGTESWQAFQVGSSYSAPVPTGATELFLGFADANGFSGVPGYYNDNTGGLNVVFTPIPQTISLITGGVGLIGFITRRKRKNRAARLELAA
jgi:hypothetical protein